MRTSDRELISELASQPITPAVVLSLRKLVGDTKSRSLLEIASVQAKAVKKFGPGIWWATARAVEQASDQVVADYKASLMGDWVVLDLCSGIGGDAMGFARRGAVITVDCDAQMTRMAAANLAAIHAQQAITVCTDATVYARGFDLAKPGLGVHLDPDRRTNNRRTTTPAEYQPSLDFVDSILKEASASTVKLAPAADLSDDVSSRCHRQWISCGGWVREQALLTGDCIGAAKVDVGLRSAIKLFRDGRRQCYQPANGEWTTATVKAPLRYIIDIDPAVRAADLSAAFACQRDLFCLGDPSGFFTTDNLPDDLCLMQCFETLWSGPMDLRQLRKQLLANGISISVIKVRCTDHDPAGLLRSLNQAKSPEAIKAWLLIGRNGNAVYAAIAKPPTSDDGSPVHIDR